MHIMSLDEAESMMIYLQIQEKFKTASELVEYFKFDSKVEKYGYEANDEELLLAAEMAMDTLNDWDKRHDEMAKNKTKNN